MRHARASQRVRRRLRTRIDGYSSTFTIDVGGGGFSFQMNRPIAPGTVLSGSFHLEGAELPFVGRVAWIAPGDPKLRIPSRMGVAFTRPPANERVLLEGAGSSAA
ncbi:MAG TPA: PilZ domain-containing protein [Anaeromyxobacteraceae bacterium]|nr:PilZ domain-containing protein [Anaeromyxobacteraceae bacterium]